MMYGFVWGMTSESRVVLRIRAHPPHFLLGVLTLTTPRSTLPCETSEPVASVACQQDRHPKTCAHCIWYHSRQETHNTAHTEKSHLGTSLSDEFLSSFGRGHWAPMTSRSGLVADAGQSAHTHPLCHSSRSLALTPKGQIEPRGWPSAMRHILSGRTQELRGGCSRERCLHRLGPQCLGWRYFTPKAILLRPSQGQNTTHMRRPSQ